MKIFFTIALLCFFKPIAFGQGETISPSHYVLKEFEKGTVKFKSGASENAILNYNSLTQEMIFLRNGEFTALAQAETIDTISIGNRKFIPRDTIFLELVLNGDVQLLVKHKCRVLQAGKPAGYGATSQASNITAVSGIPTTRAYQLKLPDDVTILPDSEFFLKKKGNYVKAINAKSVAKAFPDKEKKITDYVKANNTNFAKLEDLVKLVQFCNTN